MRQSLQPSEAIVPVSCLTSSVLKSANRGGELETAVLRATSLRRVADPPQTRREGLVPLPPPCLHASRPSTVVMVWASGFFQRDFDGGILTRRRVVGRRDDRDGGCNSGSRRDHSRRGDGRCDHGRCDDGQPTSRLWVVCGRECVWAQSRVGWPASCGAHRAVASADGPQEGAAHDCGLWGRAVG